MPKSIINLLLICLVALTGMLVIVLFLYSKNLLSSDFRINEISFSHNDGDDWIEIYNPGLNTRSLKGMYVTDDKEDVTKFEIKKDIVIPPKGFAIIYGKNHETDDASVLVANFAIKNGETIYLIDSNQDVMDSVTVISTDDDKAVSIGRFPDGSDDLFLMSTPTQGRMNIKDRLPETDPNL